MTLTPQEAAKELLARRRARSGLIEYAKYQWPGYQDAEHHRLIAEKLEAVERGEITRLMINMPPRHGKSMLASEFFPAWYIGKNPSNYIVTATYAQELADDFGRKVKNQIEDDGFKALFPGITLADDSKSAKRFHIDGDIGGVEHGTAQRGAFYAVGVGGPLTGRGAHLLLIDDPIKNRQDAESETLRKTIKDWYTSTAYTRLMPGGRIVLIQTRWHEDDLSGWLVNEHSHEGWTILNLPAISDDGQALWPEQYPIEDLERIRRALPPRDWSALYQQRPAPDTGDYFKREWLKTYEVAPHRDEMLIYGASDYAVTAKGGDYTVHVVVGVDPDGRMYLLDLWRGQASSDIWVDAFCDLVKKWKPIGWAEETGQIKSGVGPFLVKRMLEREAYVARESFPTRGDKSVRAQSIRGRMASQGLYIHVDAPWYADLVSEMMSFPVGVHDDQCFSGETLITMADGGRKPINQIVAGDGVLTPNGERTVTASVMTNPEAEVYSVEFSDGRSLIATGSHPVFIKGKGFTRVDALGIMDEIESETLCVEDLQKLRLLNTKATDTGDTRIARLCHEQGISMLPSLAVALCTGTYGKTTMGQYPPITTSITKMGTGAITLSKTLSAYQKSITGESILCLLKGMQSRLRIWAGYVTKPQSGTDRQKGGPGTRSTAKSHGREGPQEPMSVMNASVNIQPISTDQNSAAVHVRSVTGLKEKRPVYNLTVDGEHVYYANGILTHNCDALGLVGQLMDRMYSGQRRQEERRGGPANMAEAGYVLAPELEPARVGRR